MGITYEIPYVSWFAGNIRGTFAYVQVCVDPEAYAGDAFIE
jgi:hypothetical protein